MTRQEEKQQLRAIVRRLEAALAPEYKAKSARSIAHRLLAMPEYQEAQTVFCFVGTDREIDTRPILEDALAAGNLVVAIMSEGHFTSSGHFIVLRGVKDGQIMVADPASYKRSEQLWDLSIILNEASRRAGAGGPFWIIG